MIQKKIDETAEKYMMLSNSDKRLKLSSIKRAEGRATTIGFFIFVATMVFVGFLGWTGFMAAARGVGADGIGIEHVFSPILMFVMIALARTAKSSAPLWALLVSSVLSTAATFGLFFYFIPYSAALVIVEIRMAAMKSLPGYPAFADVSADGLGKNLTADQMAAYEKKQYSDMTDIEGARKRDNENLDKILRGEMDLDEFLGVEKKDTKNVRMDDYMEYHEPEPSQPEEDDIDDSAEAFFRRFEKQGGGLKEKEKEAQSWLEGGDANSAESYFDKFTESGGKLENDALYKPNISFDKAIKSPDVKK